MLNLTKTEKKACRILALLRHDDNNFIDCKFNDNILNRVKKMGIDPIELIERIVTDAT